MSENPKTILENYKNLEKDKEENFKKVVEEYSSESEMDEEESIHYEKFATEGSEAIKVMTGFSISEFMELYSLEEKKLKTRGRGKKPEIGPLDSFFLYVGHVKAL